MAISTFANNTSSGSNGSVSVATGLTVTKPSGVVDGDLIIVAICTSDTANWTPPAGGWDDTTEQVESSAGDSMLGVYYKIASGEGASWTFTPAGTEATAYVVIALRGVDSTTPVGAKAIASLASTNTPASPSINVTDSGAWLVAFFANDGSNPGPVYSNGTINVAVQQIEAGADNGLCGCWEDLAGATGATSRTVSNTQTDVHVAAALEIKPTAGGGGGVTVKPLSALGVG